MVEAKDKTTKLEVTNEPTSKIGGPKLIVKNYRLMLSYMHQPIRMPQDSRILTAMLVGRSAYIVAEVNSKNPDMEYWFHIIIAEREMPQTPEGLMYVGSLCHPDSAVVSNIYFDRIVDR